MSSERDARAGEPLHAALSDVTVRFGGQVAVDALSLHFEPGQVHAIIGENGAGKSTAVNVLFGLVAPDEGEVRIDGMARRFRSPHAAIQAGLGMVHQHFTLVEDMSVLENVVLCAEPDAGAGLVDFQAARAVLDRLAAEHGIMVEADARVRDLPFGARQNVEIVKALYRDARLLVLDEPTAVLTPRESEALFAMLRRLRDAGRTIVLITHKLDEVLAISDRVSVLRKGRLISSRRLDAGATVEDSAAGGRAGLRDVLAREIVGGDLPAPLRRAERAPGEIVLRAQAVRRREGAMTVGPLDLTLRGGEILAVAGVAGNGQGALVRALVGLDRQASPGPDASRGRIELAGVDVASVDVAGRRALGLCYVPEDRRHTGLALDASVAENASVARLDAPPLVRGPFLVRRAMRAFAAGLIERYRIAARGPRARAGTLSGGNQQKLVVARELELGGVVTIAENPTWGVDIGAIAAVHRELMAMRDDGRAILLVSSELDEVLALADRTLVMSGGHFVAEFARGEATRESLGRAMTGGAASARGSDVVGGLAA